MEAATGAATTTGGPHAAGEVEAAAATEVRCPCAASFLLFCIAWHS